MLLDRFRRVTRDGRWVPEVDGLRFLAIASVLTFHMAGELGNRSGRIIPVEPQYDWMARIIGNGDRGVILFFVISGMILALPFARQFLLGRKPVSLRKFYLRRVTRLEPPYIAAILISVTLFAIFARGLPPGYLGHVLASLFYQHGLVYGNLSPVNMVTWSLEVEIQFYILAPLFMQVFRIPGKTFRRTVMLAGIVLLGFAQLPFVQHPRFGMSLLYYLQYFLMGLVVADIFVLDLEAMKASWLWDVLGTVALGFLFWSPHDERWPHIVMPVAIAILFVAAFRSFGLRRFFAAPWIAVIGGMCYSIYLLHFIWIAGLFKWTRRAIVPSATYPVNLLIQMAVTVLPALALCVAFYLLVERPCMDPDWPSKLWHWATGRPEREVEVLDAAGISE